MRRAAILAVCCLAVTLGGLMAADSADARGRWGRSYYAPRAYSSYYYAAPRYRTYYAPRAGYYYSGPRSYYGPTYYNPRYYGGYYGRGYYAAPRGGIYIGW